MAQSIKFLHTSRILIFIIAFGLIPSCATKNKGNRFAEAKLGKVKFKYDAESLYKVKAVVAEYLVFVREQKIKSLLIQELPDSWRTQCSEGKFLGDMGDDCKAKYVVSAKLIEGFYSDSDRRFVHESCKNNICTYSISKINYAVE